MRKKEQNSLWQEFCGYSKAMLLGKASVRMFFLARIAVLFQVTLILAACAGSSGKFMVKREQAMEPPRGKAMVYFFRPSVMGFSYNFQIWDGEHILGVAQAGTYFQVPVEPGHHLFIAIFKKHRLFIEADLAPNRAYYVQTNFALAGPDFDPIAPGSKDWGNVKRWKTEVTNNAPVETELQSWEESRIGEMKNLLNHYLTVLKPEGKYKTIVQEDGEAF